MPDRQRNARDSHVSENNTLSRRRRSLFRKKSLKGLLEAKTLRRTQTLSSLLFGDKKGRGRKKERKKEKERKRERCLRVGFRVSKP